MVGFWVACHVSASPDGCFSDIWYLHVYGCFLKWWENSPQIIHGLIGFFHYFHHPFWGTTICGNIHIFSKKNKHRIFMDFLIFRVPEDMILLPQNQNPMVTLKLILMFFSFFVLEFPIALKELLINFLGQYESQGPMI